VVKRDLVNTNFGDNKMPKKTKMVVISKKGKKPLKFKGGALHSQLKVPAGQPIPAGKKKAALAGKYGSLAKKRAIFAFKGALKKGRQTVAKKKK
jgi:hypothetical protein